ncbi:hypothetical protein AKJ16_DCAP21245 [Drosera capensis]
MMLWMVVFGSCWLLQVFVGKGDFVLRRGTTSSGDNDFEGGCGCAPIPNRWRPDLCTGEVLAGSGGFVHLGLTVLGRYLLGRDSLAEPTSSAATSADISLTGQHGRGCSPARLFHALAATGSSFHVVVTTTEARVTRGCSGGAGSGRGGAGVAGCGRRSSLVLVSTSGKEGRARAYLMASLRGCRWCFGVGVALTKSLPSWRSR